MHFVRKTLVWLATAALPLWLFLIATTGSVVLTFHSPAKIKRWVSQSGIYNNVVDAVLSESQKSAQKGGDSLPISDPHVQSAAKQAFSPQVLQHNTENVIDGMYHWLQRNTPQPDFRIDLSGPKKQFATAIGIYLRDRIKHLPVCAVGQVPRSDDVFKVNCRPAGVNFEAQIRQQVNKLAHSKDFLGDPVITANDIKTDGKPLFYNPQQEGSTGRLDAVPKNYRGATMSPWLLGIVAAIGVAIIVFLHDSRRKGLKHVAWILLPLGGLVALFGLGILKAATQLEKQIHLNGAGVSKLQPAVVSLIKNATGSLGHTYIWFGLGYVVIGICLLVAVKIWFKPAESATPAHPIDSGNKPEKATAKPVK